MGLRMDQARPKTLLDRIPAGLLFWIKSWARPTVFGVAGAIRNRDGGVLLVRQTYMAGWRLPGGGVGHGEPPIAALARELKEEVGLEGGRAHLFGLYSRKVWWINHVVALYVIEEGDIHFRPNLEVRAVMWASPNAPPAGAAPATVRRLRELATGAQQDGIW
jgi:8-oxo-dGTP pyrophosphatase MutT (NUDIX family)